MTRTYILMSNLNPFISRGFIRYLWSTIGSDIVIYYSLLIREIPRPRDSPTGFIIQKLWLSFSSFYRNFLINWMFSPGSKNVYGIMSKKIFIFGPSFWTLSIFFFRRSFLAICLFPIKWLTFWKRNRSWKSICGLDQVQSRFQDISFNYIPWGNSNQLLVL